MNAAILAYYHARIPGQVYAVDGHKMRINCMGSGSPTIVLEAGLGNDGLIWSGVQPELAKTTRVCSYDRAGYGLSDTVPGPRDADHIATELDGLLHAAGIDGPIVLMGHSIAGIYIRDYATRHPEQVSGLIFVDGIDAVAGQESSVRSGRNKALPAGVVPGAGGVLPGDAALDRRVFVDVAPLRCARFEAAG